MNDAELLQHDPESPRPANWRDDMEDVYNSSDDPDSPNCHVLPEPFTFFVNPQNGQAYHFYAI